MTIVFKLRPWGDRLGPTDVSDPNFIVLRCPSNLHSWASLLLKVTSVKRLTLMVNPKVTSVNR